MVNSNQLSNTIKLKTFSSNSWPNIGNSWIDIWLIRKSHACIQHIWTVWFFFYLLMSLFIRLILEEASLEIELSWKLLLDQTLRVKLIDQLMMCEQYVIYTIRYNILLNAIDYWVHLYVSRFSTAMWSIKYYW